jgi:phosphoribosyl-ATP pyrophosphohydrolase
VGNGWAREPVELTGAPPSFASVLEDLEAVIRAREARADRPSYTRTLLDGGTAMQVAKVREEAEELAHALEAESSVRVASECADLVYHVAVALSAKKMSFGQVLEELARRFGNSGLDEKAGRQKE